MKEETRKELKCDPCCGKGYVVDGVYETWCESCQSSGLSRFKMSVKITELEDKLEAFERKNSKIDPDDDFEPQ